jgi:alpha-amylase
MLFRGLLFISEDIDSLTGYLDTFSAQFSLFDCPLRYNLQQAGTQMRDYDMRKVFDGTLTQARPMVRLACSLDVP